MKTSKLPIFKPFPPLRPCPWRSLRWVCPPVAIRGSPATTRLWKKRCSISISALLAELDDEWDPQGLSQHQPV